MDECTIGQNPVDGGTPTVRLGEKGCICIQAANINHPCPVEVKAGSTVHIQCRKEFTRPKSKIVPTNIASHHRTLRSDTEQFDFKSKCLFCASFAKFSLTTKKRSHDVYPVRSLDFQDKILHDCVERNDNWANEVHCRLTQVLDLPAAEAVYHQACSVNLRTGKNVPKAFDTSEQCSSAKEMKSPRRPEATEQANAFKQIIETIETCEDATLTVIPHVYRSTQIIQCF